MNFWKWLLLVAGLAAVYSALIMLVSFEHMAIPIHFGRVAAGYASLVIIIPALSIIFRHVPAPGRDYLVASMFFTWLSGSSFATFNEIGRLFDIDTSVFTSPVAGFFSLLLVIGGVWLIFTPDIAGKGRKTAAVVVGLVAGVAIVLVAPLFR